MEMKSTSSALSRNNRNRINKRRLILTRAVMGNNIDRNIYSSLTHII